MMYCVHCGANIPETAKFCPKCGADLRQRPSGVTDPTHVRDIVSKITALCAAAFMIVALIVPFFNVRVILTFPCTLFGVFDEPDVVSEGTADLKVMLIIAYLLFVVMFLVFTAVPMKNGGPVVGCAGSWLLFFIMVFMVIDCNDSADYNVLSFSYGFYAWVLGGLLEVVSIAVDPAGGVKRKNS